MSFQVLLYFHYSKLIECWIGFLPYQKELMVALVELPYFSSSLRIGTVWLCKLEFLLTVFFLLLFSNVEILVSTDSAISAVVYSPIITGYQLPIIFIETNTKSKIVVLCKCLSVSLAKMNFPSQ